MAWVAFDRTIKTAEAFGEGLDHWRKLGRKSTPRSGRKAFNQARRIRAVLRIDTWTRARCSSRGRLLPPDDPRVAGTVEAIERSS
jgi:hypothetical protein